MMTTVVLGAGMLEATRKPAKENLDDGRTDPVELGCHTRSKCSAAPGPSVVHVPSTLRPVGSSPGGASAFFMSSWTPPDTSSRPKAVAASGYASKGTWKKSLQSPPIVSDMNPRTYSRRCVWLLVALVSLVRVQTTVAQTTCDLVNPSFEVPGQFGAVFGGWNQFGAVSSDVSMVVHGSVAAAATGSNSGSWALSAYWQKLDTQPGDQWRATARAGHASADPITGQAQLILNIEWRDAANALISFESHVLVDATTPPDVMLPFEITSAPAPAGTVATHFLIGFLQSPANDPGTAIFDALTFIRQGTPSHEDRQWNDFPGGRAIEFAGHTWRVKGPGLFGPGPNNFADGPSNVWVDLQGQLHTTITKFNTNWFSTELALSQPLGYGDYVFTTQGDLATLADNVIFASFFWEYSDCFVPGDFWNLHNEFDVEISRWGDPAADQGQFVAQPFSTPGNLSRFALPSMGPTTEMTFALGWGPDMVDARAWVGGPDAESPQTLIHSFPYSGMHIPRDENARVHISLWHLDSGPANGLDQEVVVSDFRFIPACAQDIDGSGGVDVEDLYQAHALQIDLDLDRIVTPADTQCLEQFVRAGEAGDVNGSGL